MKIIYWFTSNDEIMAFLEELEKRTYYLRASGEKPTQFKNWWYIDKENWEFVLAFPSDEMPRLSRFRYWSLTDNRGSSSAFIHYTEFFWDSYKYEEPEIPDLLFSEE